MLLHFMSVELLIYKLNDILEQKNYKIRFKPYRCEREDSAMTINGSQYIYDRHIETSSMCVFLFGNNIGKYTKNELNLALENKNEQPSKKILVFFQDEHEKYEGGNLTYFNEIKSNVETDWFNSETMLCQKICVAILQMYNIDCNFKVENEVFYVDNTPFFKV